MRKPSEVIELVQTSLKELPVGQSAHVQIMNIMKQLKDQFLAAERAEAKAEAEAEESRNVKVDKPAQGPGKAKPGRRGK